MLIHIALYRYKLFITIFEIKFGEYVSFRLILYCKKHICSYLTINQGLKEEKSSKDFYAKVRNLKKLLKL